MKALTTTQIVNYTNARLNNWYENAKEDYGVIGNGSASYNSENDTIVITYTEDGVTGVFELGYYHDNAIDWVFNVWSEQADIENDKISA